MVSQLPSPKSARVNISIDLPELTRLSSLWIRDGEVRRLSKTTLYSRRFITEKLLWFLKTKNYTACSKVELLDFFAYLSESSEQRWGKGKSPKEIKAGTAATYFARIRTMFEYLVHEEWIEASPMATMRPPVYRPDEIQPFTREQLQALTKAAKKTRYRHRDLALILFLLDTGVRASELCSLKFSDLNLEDGSCNVLGKGNKVRTLHFGVNATKALWDYLQRLPRSPSEPVFMSESGANDGGFLTRSGLSRIIERLGKSAGIEQTRCSAHTFRHTFAVTFLRNGGNSFALQKLMGHTSLTMTRLYVALAETDLADQHRKNSPADVLRLR